MDWLLHFADPTIDWDYAIITLFIRFGGVFTLMVIMMAALQAAAVGVRRYESRGAAAATAAAPSPATGSANAAVPSAPPAGVDGAVAAAIALALALEERPAAGPRAAAAGPSPWAMAGRMQQLAHLPRR